MHVEADADVLEEMKHQLRIARDERNQLVHHFLKRLHPHSPENLQFALDYLNAQETTVTPLHDRLLIRVGSLQVMAQTIACKRPAKSC
jgi:hypothetical protein